MTEAISFSSLPHDTLLNIWSNFTAPQLCLTRLVCRLLQKMIDEPNENPLWRGLALRTGLRPMTPEKDKDQTYQTYLQKNWKFCLLNETSAECFTPTILHRIRAAIRSGHEAIVLTSLDRWKKQPLLWTNVYKFALESIKARLKVSFLNLMLLYQNWTLNEGSNKEAMKVLFFQIALRGDDVMMLGLVTINIHKTFLSNPDIAQAFDLSASQGHLKVLTLLLGSYPDAILPTTVDGAYHQALVFSPCSETTEFLRTKASVEAQKREKESLINFYKTQFCTNWLELPPPILRQRAEFYLKQDGFFENLNDAQRQNILKALIVLSGPGILQLFMVHPQFAPLIAANIDPLTKVMIDVRESNEWYTVEVLISFLKTLEKAAPQGTRDFKSYAAAVVWATIVSGRDDFIQPFVQNFPGLIPANLVPRFLAAAQNSSSGNVYEQLVAGGGFEEMEWFCKYVKNEQSYDLPFEDNHL